MTVETSDDTTTEQSTETTETSETGTSEESTETGTEETTETTEETSDPHPWEAELTSAAFSDIELPEGVDFPEDEVNAFLEVANSATSKEEFMKIVVADYIENLAATATESEDQFRATMDEWVAETKADPTVGGENSERILGEVKETVKRYGGEELLQVFDLTGVGNNVHMVKFVHAIAALIPTEGTPAQGNSQQTEKSAAQALFGGTSPN
jgi:hypothetical protein